MGLSEDFYDMLRRADEHPEVMREAAEMVFSAPADTESDGLLALMYHEGFGVERDLDKAFVHASRAAQADEGVALYLLGYMCENAETPDQAEGGPRQQYDHYDAEQFMERCAATGSSWAEPAHLWLGDYYMNMARGGDPEVALEHYEAIGHDNREAAGKLSDYYWEQLDYDEADEELAQKVFEWTHEAVRLDPAGFSFRMGICYAEGIGCDATRGFRLARKYWEDAFDFGDPDAADAIATLYEERMAMIAGDSAEAERERAHCRREMESWHRLAERARARQRGEQV